MEKSKISNIIKEEIEFFLEDFKFNNDQKVFDANPAMVSCAQKGLDAIKIKDLTNGGNEGSGREKAISIIKKDPLTHNMLKRMKAFFDNNYSNYQTELGAGKDLTNSGVIQSWNLWGGDAGREMSSRNIDHVQRDNQSRKDIKTFMSPSKTSTIMNPNNTRIRK